MFSRPNDTQVSLALHNYHLYFKETSRTQVKEKLKASLCLRNKRFCSSYGVKIWSQSPSLSFICLLSFHLLLINSSGNACHAGYASLFASYFVVLDLISDNVFSVFLLFDVFCLFCLFVYFAFSIVLSNPGAAASSSARATTCFIFGRKLKDECTCFDFVLFCCTFRVLPKVK